MPHKRKANKLDNHDATRGVVEQYSKLAMKDNVKRFIDNHRFSTRDINFDVSAECLDCFRSNDLDDIGKVIEENPHIQEYFTHDPPQLLSGKDYTIITSHQRQVIVGSGSFGVAFLGKENKSNNLVVIKLMMDPDAPLIRLLEEYAMQRRASHVLRDGCSAPEVKGILVLKEDAKLRRDYYPYLLVQEFCAFASGAVGLTLDAALKQNAKSPMFSETEWEDISFKLLHGTNQLQKHNIHHLDLHSENILLQLFEDELKVIFIDFGHAIGTWSTGDIPIFHAPSYFVPGTTYTAPELFTQSYPLKTSDFYSCAYMIKDIADETKPRDKTGNTRLGQEMQQYIAMVPEKRTGYSDLYYRVQKHSHGYSPFSISNFARNHAKLIVFVLIVFFCLLLIFVMFA